MTAASHLTDEVRFPLLSESGRTLLGSLRQHPHAPRFNMQCGDRLDSESLADVQRFEEQLRSNPPRWREGEIPGWAGDYAESVSARVPFYRRKSGGKDFLAIPPCGRDDLQDEPWSFVPDDADLSELILYYTSGTHGRPLHVLASPAFASKRLPLFRAALASCGVTLDGGSGRVAILFVCSQLTTLTYASVSTFLGEAAHVKINLNPAEWRSADDRVAFIDECNSEILSGDPLSFLDLAELPVRIGPKALISSAMTLLPALRQRLEERFGCPVLDIYSTCESGPIAFADGDRFRILPGDLFVETLDENGQPCRPGSRGEIALTGGRNPYFPMLRYKTGDTAILDFEEDAPFLRDLEGRLPVTFFDSAGHTVNNIDVATVLRQFALAQFSLHQNADRSLRFAHRGAESARPAIAEALRSLFGSELGITIEPIPPDTWKVLPYSSDLPLPSS